MLIGAMETKAAPHCIVWGLMSAGSSLHRLGLGVWTRSFAAMAEDAWLQGTSHEAHQQRLFQNLPKPLQEACLKAEAGQRTMTEQEVKDYKYLADL